MSETTKESAVASSPAPTCSVCRVCGLADALHPRCPNCNYTECDCRVLMDHKLCGLPDPAPAAKAYGCACPVCGTQIYDSQLIVDTEDGMAHEECCNRGGPISANARHHGSDGLGWSNLRAHWDACAKNDTDFRTDEERVLLGEMFTRYESLKKLGWSDIIYCPKDGTEFLSISAGSTGVHRCHYDGEWPKGYWWVSEAGDMWPAHPILWKPMPPNQGMLRTGKKIEGGNHE